MNNVQNKIYVHIKLILIISFFIGDASISIGQSAAWPVNEHRGQGLTATMAVETARHNRARTPVANSLQAEPIVSEIVTIQDYLTLGLQQNLALQQIQTARDQAHSELRTARGRFLPEATLDASYSFASGGRTIDFPLGDLLNPVYGTLNDLTGQASFPTNLENVEQQLLPDNFHETRLRVVQPLFNTDIYYSYRAWRDLVSAEESRIQVAKQDLVLAIKLQYLAYFAAEDQLRVLESNRQLVAELVETTHSLVRNGKATSDQLFTAQYELSRLDASMAGAFQQRDNARARFNLLLNRDLASTIYRDEAFLEMNQNQVSTVIPGNANHLLERTEFDLLRHRQSAARNLLRMNRSGALPNLFMVGDIGYQGVNYNFARDQDFWFIQFGLRWNLFRGFQNQEKITRSQLELRQLDTRYEELEQQIRLQVDDAWQALETANAREDAARQGLLAATSAFEIIKRRYEENQVLMVEYLRAQDTYTRARLQLNLAQYQRKSAESVLERETGR